MDYQKNFESIFIQYIRQKFDDNLFKVRNIYFEHDKRVKRIEKAKEDLEAFQEKHKHELDKIFEGMVVYYFCSAWNDLRIHEDYEDQWLQHELDQVGGKDGYIYLTYADFEKDLGVTRETAKKYCELLIEKGAIERKKGMGGLFYKCSGEDL